MLPAVCKEKAKKMTSMVNKIVRQLGRADDEEGDDDILFNELEIWPRLVDSEEHLPAWDAGLDRDEQQFFLADGWVLTDDGTECIDWNIGNARSSFVWLKSKLSCTN